MMGCALASSEPRLELGVPIHWNYVKLFWNSLDNTPSSIVFYLEMKVEVGVHYIRSRFTPRVLGWVEKTEIVFFENTLVHKSCLL